MKEEHQLQSCTFVHRLFSQEKNWMLRIENRGPGATNMVHKKRMALEKSSIRKDMVKSLVLLWLEGKTWKRGNIWEITEMHEGERWETPERHPDARHAGLVTVSRTMAWAYVTCCPTLPALPVGKSSSVLMNITLWASEYLR